MPQLPVRGPFTEPDLGDEPGLDPVHPGPRQAADGFKGRRRPLVGGQRRVQAGQGGPVEAGADLSGVVQPAVGAVVAEQERAEVPVYIYLFDVLWADGHDVRPRPLLERKTVLHDLLSFGGPLRYAEHRDTDGEAYYREACQLGWEGLIAKRVDSPYRPGRNRDWLKFKCLNGQEFVIGGYTDPRGSRVGFGALLLGYYGADRRLHYAGKVGTGFDRPTLNRLHAAQAADERPAPAFQPVRGLPRSRVHWVEPRLVAQVGFSEWTADGELRHPRFQGLRRDKDPADVVRELP